MLVNIAIELALPPEVVTPPPDPAQLPVVRQTVPLALGRLIVWLAERVVVLRVDV